MKLVRESLDESYEKKDLKRIQDIVSKGGGDFDKELSLATTMSKLITNVDKAIARAEASVLVYGGPNEISNIFYDRAKKLGYTGDSPEDVRGSAGIPGSRLPAEKRYKSDHPLEKPIFYHRLTRTRENYVLPIGYVNLRTGENKHFNIYDTWDGTVEVWLDKRYKGAVGGDEMKFTYLRPKSKEEIDKKMNKYRLIFTSGKEPLHEIGEKGSFIHDQGHYMVGKGWDMVDYIRVKDMAELIPLYGKNILGYAYK